MSLRLPHYVDRWEIWRTCLVDDAFLLRRALPHDFQACPGILTMRNQIFDNNSSAGLEWCRCGGSWNKGQQSWRNAAYEATAMVCQTEKPRSLHRIGWCVRVIPNQKRHLQLICKSDTSRGQHVALQANDSILRKWKWPDWSVILKFALTFCNAHIALQTFLEYIFMPPKHCTWRRRCSYVTDVCIASLCYVYNK